MLQELVVLLFCVSLTFARQGNFICIDSKKHKEWKEAIAFEKRVRYNEITAEEVAVQNYVTHKSVAAVHEMTDGDHLIQLIYSSNKLVDCNYVEDKTEITTFITKFNDKITQLESLANKQATRGEEKVNVTFSALDEATDDVKHLLTPYRELKIQCMEMERNRREVIEQINNTNTTAVTRSKRALWNKKYMFPGSNYCGPHNVAPSGGRLGGYNQADFCCKKHDECPYSIPAFSGKYNVVNVRPTTMSHCHCDDRFYTCLRMTNTDASNMVGNIFFNLIKTKCFTLKKENVCSKKSWWGKCLKYDWKKQATIRNPIPYPT